MPRKSYRTEDVFGVTAKPLLSYVNRSEVDDKLRGNLHNDKVVLVHGPSGQGKTWLVLNGLSDSNFALVSCTDLTTIEQLRQEIYKDFIVYCTDCEDNEVEWKTGLSMGVVRAERTSRQSRAVHIPNLASSDDLARKLDEFRTDHFAPTIVIDDIHCMPPVTLQGLSELVRNLFNRQIKVFALAAWREPMLPGLSGQLTNRMDVIDAGKWPDHCLQDLIQSGSNLLNIEFSTEFREAIIENAHHNASLVQHACYDQLMHFSPRIETTCTLPPGPLGSRESAEAIFSNRFSLLNSDFQRAFKSVGFKACGKRHALREARAAIIAAVLTADNKDLVVGLSFDKIWMRVQDRRRTFNRNPISNQSFEAAINDPNFGLATELALRDITFFDTDVRAVLAQSQLFLAWRRWLSFVTLENLATEIEKPIVGKETSHD